MNLVRWGLLGSLVLVGACIPRTSEPPPPQQPVQPPPAPAPAPPSPPPPPLDWADLPLAPGSWTYRDEPGASLALFGPTGSTASFTVRCEKGRGQVLLIREGITTGNTMTVRTSFGARNFPLSVQQGAPHQVYTRVAASDPFLDSMVFSRGRISVQVPGTPMLVIPSWPEPARVIEDCRS